MIKNVEDLFRAFFAGEVKLMPYPSRFAQQYFPQHLTESAWYQRDVHLTVRYRRQRLILLAVVTSLSHGEKREITATLAIKSVCRGRGKREEELFKVVAEDWQTVRMIIPDTKKPFQNVFLSAENSC